MIINYKKTVYMLLSLSAFSLTARSQTKALETKTSLFEGVIVAGYVDKGAFINCAGPAIKFSKRPLAVLVGLLPSLRIKEDEVATGATKNAVITPNLGAGITAIYKHLAIQVPVYYNAKTSAKDGKWNAGIGIGYKF